MGPYKDSKARDPEVAAAVRSGIAVGVAVSLYGVSFGALAVAAGLDVWQTCVLSLLMFTGGLAVRPHRRARGRRRSRRGTRRDRELDAPRHPERPLRAAHGADRRTGVAEAPPRGALDDRRDDRGLDGPADAPRAARGILGHRRRRLCRLERHDPRRRPPRRPHGRSAQLGGSTRRRPRRSSGSSGPGSPPCSRSSSRSAAPSSRAR